MGIGLLTRHVTADDILIILELIMRTLNSLGDSGNFIDISSRKIGLLIL